MARRVRGMMGAAGAMAISARVSGIRLMPLHVRAREGLAVLLILSIRMRRSCLERDNTHRLGLRFAIGVPKA